MGICLGIINGLALFFVNKVDEETSYEEIETKLSKDEQSCIEKNHGSNFPFWLTLDFQLLIWSYALVLSVSHVNLAMFSTYVQSLNFEEYMTPLLSATPFITCALLIIIEFLSDASLHICSRMSIVLVLCILFTVVVVLCVQFIDDIIILVLLAIATSGAVLDVDILVPPELHKVFGRNRFGTSLGIGSILSGVLMWKTP